jgi:hypothetical protein
MLDQLTRYVLAACFAVFLAIIGITAAVGPAGCGAPTRKDTIEAALIAVNTSSEAFAAWDLARQREILAANASRDTYNVQITAHREAQARVLARFNAVYRLITIAATKNEPHSTWDALTAAGEIVDEVQAIMKSKAKASAPVPIPADAGAP